MNTENQLIEIISVRLPRSVHQVNKLFESDAEIVKGPDGYQLFSVDDFSGEDHFRTENPYNLGWNLVVATISDIYASGGQPEFFLHSVAFNTSEWDNTFIEDFTNGIGNALTQAGVTFLGGDFGTSKEWHYTGIVTGKSFKPLTRKGAAPGQTILMTGSAGAGNAEAAISVFKLEDKFPPVEFRLRKKESELISKFATACIDTSDGVVNSLNILSDINNTGFEITSCSFHPLARQIVTSLGVPEELLLLGECGEYELLFTIDTNALSSFIAEAEKLKLQISVIGNITNPNQKIVRTAHRAIDLIDFSARGRDFSDEKDYITNLIQYIKSHGINEYNQF